jgi:hypothetical protein
VLSSEECEARATVCARLADVETTPEQVARYRQLEQSWLYVARMKIRATIERKRRAVHKEQGQQLTQH